MLRRRMPRLASQQDARRNSVQSVYCFVSFKHFHGNEAEVDAKKVP